MRHSSFENKQFRLQNSPPGRQPCVAQELEKKKDDDRRWQQATTAQEIRVFPSNDKDGTVCFSDITLISSRPALFYTQAACLRSSVLISFKHRR